MTTTTSTATPTITPDPAPSPETTRRRVAAIGLGLAAVTVAALLVTTPWGARNATGYDAVAAVRDAAWVGILIDGIAFAVLGVSASLTVLSLVRRRGQVLALLGALATSLGGVLFAMGSYAFVSLAWYATAPATPEPAGRALMALAETNPLRGIAPTMVGFLLFMVGSLLLAVALFRSRAVPRLAVGAFVLLTVSQFVGVEGRGLNIVQIGLMLLLTGLAVIGFRRAPGPSPAAV